MKYKLDDIVRSKVQIIVPACGDHPAMLWCDPGDELVVLKLFPASDFPEYGKDSYSVRHTHFTTGYFFIDEDELENK